MTTTLMVVFGVMAVALVAAPALRPDHKKRALTKARATGDLSDLVAYIESSPSMTRADAWDQLLLELWRTYDRELAAKVLMVAVPRCDAKILQHWVMQVLQIEPEISAEIFTAEFLNDHFRPDVASQCGKCGCGG